MRAQAADLEAREQALDAAQRALEQLQEDAESALLASRETLVSLERRASEARTERDQILGRQRSLQRMREQMSDYHPGVREVLRAADSLKGIRGTVATLMRVPQEYEQAIQSALGSRLENIVTEHWDDAEAAIALLKQRQAGWATFLPLDSLHVRPALKPRPMAGIVGVASELVRYDSELQPVFDLLLGHVLIVQDLPAARRLLRERTGASLLVTLKARRCNQRCSQWRYQATQTRLLQQEREWRELPAHLQSAEALMEATNSVAAIQDRIGEIQAALRQRTLEITQGRRDRERAHQALLKHGDELVRAERDYTWLASRATQIDADLEQLSHRQQTVSLATASLSEQGEQLAAQLSELATRRDAIQDAPQRQRLNALETEAEVSARTARSVTALLESHIRNLEQIDQQIAIREAQRKEQTERLQELNSQLAQRQERLAALEALVEETRAQLAPIHAKRVELEREEQRTIRQHSDSLDRLHEAETEYNQTVLERDRAPVASKPEREIEESGAINLPGVNHQLRLSLDDNVVELPRHNSPQGQRQFVSCVLAAPRRQHQQKAPRVRRLLGDRPFCRGKCQIFGGAIASLHEVIGTRSGHRARLWSYGQARGSGFANYFEELFGGGSARWSPIRTTWRPPA